MRIQQLPLEVVNQIAAGEVIERPASVVKELLENALDAKASSINIEIFYGGLNQIKISDNGIGIHSEDLAMAVAPHATSKIGKFEDLYSIKSMGFRGEALASVASISKLTISSKTKEQNHAMKLVMENHQFKIEPCARTQGTTIDVQDLFFNVPVRKKFLKTERLEFQAIEMVVKRFALSAPQIAIDFSHNGKKVLHLPVAQTEKNQLARIQQILGRIFLEQSQYIEIEHGGIKLLGWVGNPDYQRSQNDKQWIYVNGRMIKDKLLNHAIKQGYESVLHPGKFPVCLLYLVINPQEVDVNVHPTKHEIRFHQARWVHDLISNSIKQVVAPYSSPPNSSLSLDLGNLSNNITKEKNRLNHVDQFVPFEPFDVCQSPWLVESETQGQITQGDKFTEQPVKKFVAEKAEKFEVQEPKIIFNQVLEKPIRSAIHPMNLNTDWMNLNDVFSVLFLNGKAILVDTLKLYEQYLNNHLSQNSLPLQSRPVTVPLTYTFTELSAMSSENFSVNSILNQIGIDFTWVGEKTIVIRTLPVEVPYLNFKSLLESLNARNLIEIDLIQLIIKHQDLNAKNISQEEKEKLIDYFLGVIQSGEISEPKERWWKELFTSALRELLYA